MSSIADAFRHVTTEFGLSFQQVQGKRQKANLNADG
jgi:hypothetical protein